MLDLLLLLAAAIASDFPGGVTGPVDWPTSQHVRVGVQGQSDQDDRNRQASWYYFRIDDATPDKEIAVTLTDLLGEYNYRAGTHAVTEKTRPVISYDNKTWTHVDQVQWDEEATELTFRFAPKQSPVWIAHTPPYTNEHLATLAQDFQDHPHFDRASAGNTVQGREIPLWTIADPAGPQDRPVVWLMFRQHAWESGTSWAADGALRFLLGNSAEAKDLRRNVTWKLFPLADPDGAYHGGVRFNRNGYDLNRNWDALDPATMPENYAQHQAVKLWLASGKPINIFLTVHNTESSEYLEGPAEHRALVNRFRDNLTRLSSFDETRAEPQDARPSTTPGMKGRMSVNQGLHADFRIPSMLMETRVQAHPGLGGRSRNIPDWLTYGEGLVRAAAATVLE